MHLGPRARRLISTSTLLLLALGALATPGKVAAQALHYDPSSGTWVRSPARMLYVTPQVYVAPQRQPDVVVRVIPPVQRYVSISTPVEWVQEQPVEPEPVELEPSEATEHTGLVVGAGFGALGSLRHRSRAGMAAEIHLGIERGAAEFDLGFTLAPSALGADVTAASPQGGGIYGAAASLAYRPWHYLRLHPVVGLGFEALFANAHQEESHLAFGVVGRFGVEVTFPMEPGRLSLGLDGTLHQVLGSSAAYPTRANSLYGFGAHLDYRFGR